MKENFSELIKKVIKFRDERNWKQFHNSKDVAISMVLEAGEVLEHFQWKTEAEIKIYLETHKEHIGDEIADVLKYLVILSYDLDIDVIQAVKRKMKKDAEKYPVSKSKDNHKKYNEL